MVVGDFITIEVTLVFFLFTAFAKQFIKKVKDNKIFTLSNFRRKTSLIHDKQCNTQKHDHG